MKRKLVNIALFLPLLACLMGANTISFNQGSPKSPAPKTIEAQGTYALDPGYAVVNINFYWRLTGQGQTGNKLAAYQAGNWSITTTVTNAGTYECWANMAAFDGKNFKTVNTPLPNPSVPVN